MKKLLVAVFFLIIIVGGIVGGAYAYASSNEEQLAIDLNITELNELEFTSYIEARVENTSTFELQFPLLLGSELSVQNTSVTETLEVDIENDEVVKFDEDGKQIGETFTVDEYRENESPFPNAKTWTNLIDEKNYKLEDDEIEFKGKNTSVWKYTFESDRLNEDYKNIILSELTSEFANFQVPGFSASVDEFSVSFDGNFTFVLYVGSEDYEMKKAEVITNDPLVVNLTFGGDVVEQTIGVFQLIEGTIAAGGEPVAPEGFPEEDFDLLVLLYQSLGEVPTAEATITLRDIQVDYYWEEFEIRDGQSIPANPLMLLIASIIS